MTVYGIEFRHGLFLAPLSGYTDWPMRMLCRRYGAELAYTEMISATGLVRREKNTLMLLERPVDDKPLIAQLFSSDPDECGHAARILEEAGFDGIDINMGCPVKKVVTKGCGSALMRDPLKAEAIVMSVKSAVKLPVSVKMRAGWDNESLNADQLAARLVAAGAQCITIHPRTRAQMYGGRPLWEMFERIRQTIKAPLIASGDIRTMRDLETLKDLGAQASMIGRAAIGRPWIFRELTGGDPPLPGERRALMLEHLDLSCRVLGEDRGVRCMRKILCAYVKGLSGASGFREKVCTLEYAQEVKDYIDHFFASGANDELARL
ncbi:MAG: tRNA dihydrouridine synthase DusB [Syntrophaceae bacterium]